MQKSILPIDSNRTIEKLLLTDKKKARTPAAFILLKVNKNAYFFNIYEKLYAMENILLCEVVKGDIDIFLFVQAESIEKCKGFFDTEIKPLKDLKEALFLPISIPGKVKDKTTDSANSVFSYILAEAEKEEMENISKVLKSAEDVIYFDFASGKYNLILKIQGANFVQIDKFIEHTLINLKGILKIKEYPIIDIYEKQP